MLFTLTVLPHCCVLCHQMELETWLCATAGDGDGGGACLPEDIVLIDTPAKTNTVLHQPHKFAILSYHYLSKLEAMLCAKKYKMIIIDESHFLKNGKAKRTKSMHAVAEGAARVSNDKLFFALLTDSCLLPLSCFSFSSSP